MPVKVTKLMNQWYNNVKFAEDNNIAYCVSIKTSSAWSSALAGRFHSSAYKIPIVFWNSVESCNPIIVNCIKNGFINMHDVSLCIHLHMYKYTHAGSLLSHFTLYTLLYLCSSKCTGLFWAILLFTLVLSAFIYKCTDPLFNRFALHIVSFPVHVYAQTLC